MMKAVKKKEAGFGNQVPPCLLHVSIYFSQKGFSNQEAIRFFEYHESIHWKNAEGNPIQNWKTIACEWIWNRLHSHGTLTM